MLFTVRNNAFGESLPKNIKIVKNKKYGIMNESDNTYILPEEYDNIFLYGINAFALHKNGKIGLCRIEDEKLVILCECKYDVIDNYNHDLFLSNDNETLYFNSNTKEIRIFKEIVTDTMYLYGYDEDYQYIIHQESGKVVYKKELHKYNKSYYVYCGESEKGAVFYDTSFSTIIYPTDEGYMPYEYPLNHPVIVNKHNVMNIIDGENGIGIIDSEGNSIIENNYDEITVELKITAKNKNERVEKIIKIPNNTFTKDKVSAIGDWI